MNKEKRIRAASVLIQGDHVLLMHRIKNGKEYYVFPGGGVESGELIEEAALRELLEETSVKADMDRLLYVHEYDDGDEQYFYRVQNPIGTPHLPAESEEMNRMSETNFFEPMWVDLNTIESLRLFPLEIRDWFVDDLKTHFVDCPRKAFIKRSEIRE